MSPTLPPVRIRLEDIAAQAKVSTATVSRVLNGKPGVSLHARQAVLEALDLLGYERPERLRTRSAGLVGLIVPELSNPVFPALAQAIETALADRGFTPLLCTQTAGGTTEDQYVDVLLEHSVDGIVFVSGLHADTTAGRDRYHRLRSRGIPIVLVNGHDPSIDAPSISNDDVTSMDLAFRHLVSLGHRRIGLAIGPDRFVPTQRKLAGFVEAFDRYLGATDAADATDGTEHVVTTLFTVAGGRAAARELLTSGHTAIICGSDLMALGAVTAAGDLGRRVPEDVSIVGFDDSPLIAYTAPPLTTVRQPVTEMGTAAAQAMVSEIRGTRATRSELLFRPELIVRGSTGAAPQDA